MEGKKNGKSNTFFQLTRLVLHMYRKLNKKRKNHHKVTSITNSIFTTSNSKNTVRTCIFKKINKHKPRLLEPSPAFPLVDSIYEQ